jgi:hypothetical protein
MADKRSCYERSLGYAIAAVRWTTLRATNFLTEPFRRTGQHPPCASRPSALVAKPSTAPLSPSKRTRRVMHVAGDRYISRQASALTALRIAHLPPELFADVYTELAWSH